MTIDEEMTTLVADMQAEVKQYYTGVCEYLGDDNGNSVMGVPQEELDAVLAEAAEAIPETVAGIFNYWQRKQAKAH